ncbi:MAG TPA: bifunctional hydroxymethylpyrimidine kinase/phosphomethylpyrimidine kinase [Candidatus Binataceae bacterium]
MKKTARSSGRRRRHRNDAGNAVALTIAGSDPGGGAGLQADLKTFAALGVYGYSAITAVIAQNSSTVNRVALVAPAMIAAQIETLAAERLPDAIKTGALGSAGIVEAVADSISRLDLPAPVVDPVLISSAGVRLLDLAGQRGLLRRLLPLARIVTPNLAEAQALTGVDGASPAALRAMALALTAAGTRAVLIKGGHVLSQSRGESREESTDLFYDGREFVELRAARIPGGGAHGLGCALSAAIAAYLAQGMELLEAVRQAKRYVSAALRARFRLGAGRAVLDHFVRK